MRWEGRPFYLGKNKKVYDAEVYAIYIAHERSDGGQIPDHQGLDPRAGRAEEQQHSTTAKTGAQGLSLPLPVPLRPRRDWILSVRQDPKDRRQQLLVVQQRRAPVQVLLKIDIATLRQGPLLRQLSEHDTVAIINKHTTVTIIN